MEVVDGYLAKLYSRTPIWREIADVVEHIIISIYIYIYIYVLC